MNKAALLDHLAGLHDWPAYGDAVLARHTTLAELNSMHTRLHTGRGYVHSHAAKPNKETTMSTDLPAVPAPDLKLDLNRSLSPAEGAALRAHAMEYVKDERFERVLPRFLTELPWAGTNEAITDRIAAMLLTSPDPDRMPDGDGSISFQKLVRHSVEVFDIAVMAGDKDSGWAAYLLLDVTVDDDPEHIVVNTGAKEAVMRLAVAWARDELPLRGRVVEKPVKSASGNKPLMFLAEKDFTTPAGDQQVGAT